MSDYDENFDDSFDSESDSDRVDVGVGEDDFCPEPERRSIPFSSFQPQQQQQPGPHLLTMKDFVVLQGGNGARDSLSDHDDFRSVQTPARFVFNPKYSLTCTSHLISPTVLAFLHLSPCLQ